MRSNILGKRRVLDESCMFYIKTIFILKTIMLWNYQSFLNKAVSKFMSNNIMKDNVYFTRVHKKSEIQI